MIPSDGGKHSGIRPSLRGGSLPAHGGLDSASTGLVFYRRNDNITVINNDLLSCKIGVRMSVEKFRCGVSGGFLFLLVFMGQPYAQLNELPLPVGNKTINVAVMQAAAGSGISEEEVGLIFDRLRVELFNTGKVNVMEREKMADILKEQGFQQAGICTDASCATEVGQLLGVQAIISGSMGRLGSVFMLNFRVIDVRTGKLLAAVSRDVDGDIESLIGYIRGIADELAAIATNSAAPSVSASAPAAKERRRPAAAAPHANRNRNGIRIVYGAHWGVPQIQLDGQPYAIATHNTFGSGYSDSSIFTCTPLMHGELSLIFKAGPYINITAGPAMQWFLARSTYKSDNSSAETHIDYTFANIGTHLGVAFVKRILPWKVNAGLFYDLGYCFWSSKVDSVDAFGKQVPSTTVLGLSYGDQTNFAWSLGHGVGFQGGVEYVIKERLGINLDCFFRFLNPTFEFGNDNFFGDEVNRDRHIKWLTNYPDFSHHPKFNVILPMIGGDVGINFYF
jgi:TolB-like protein